ncbi:MAG: NAD(P)-dependent alcohol dehydrogenase [Candidatus Tectomicrobia bacterium]
MKAMVGRCYGGPDVLTYEDIAKPVPADDEVLVRIHAAAINPYDYHFMRGLPYLMRLIAGIGKPDNIRMGVDFAGTVEAVGKDVTRFSPGDEVFGGRTGALAGYVTIREEKAIALKPADVTFEQAASVGIAAITALQALRDKGQVQAGQRVLINGASGGVGTFAVQIGKSYGAEVSGVCSTRNVDMVRSIGADHVFDYKKEDFTQSGEQFDLIVDMVGNQPLRALNRVLKPEGTLVMVGGPKGPWIKPLIYPIKSRLMQPFVEQNYVGLLAVLNQEDLAYLGELMATGQVTPVIDRRWSLSEAAEAMRYLETGRARGKVIISID